MRLAHLTRRSTEPPLDSWRRHVWVSGALADRLLARPEASGRSTMEEMPFGDEFLFLVRDPKRAQTIRSKQQAWLRERAGADQIAATIGSAEATLAGAFGSGWTKETLDWPAYELSAALMGALLSVFVGSPSAHLSEQERIQLLLALAGYRGRAGLKTDTKSFVRASLTKKEDYAREVRALCLEALRRSGRPESELPMLVAAVVSGGEVFPLLLRWIVRRWVGDVIRILD